jgi:hypothetical protein
LKSSSMAVPQPRQTSLVIESSLEQTGQVDITSLGIDLCP